MTRPLVISIIDFNVMLHLFYHETCALNNQPKVGRQQLGSLVCAASPLPSGAWEILIFCASRIPDNALLPHRVRKIPCLILSQL